MDFRSEKIGYYMHEIDNIYFYAVNLIKLMELISYSYEVGSV
jgi:hypothetical protein